MIERGLVLVEVLPPDYAGGRPGYRLESDLSADEATEIMVECGKLAPPPPELTDGDIRLIYDRWVAQGECMTGLGYHPDEPPSFETFASDWRTTGPWSPIDGVDTGSWTDADYQEAKESCTLEMFIRR